MIAPGVPANEAQRIEALHGYQILDTEPEEAFQDLVELAAHVLEVPIMLISLVDSERQWFKACVGLEAGETHRSLSFCGHAVEQDGPLEIQDTLLDPRFADNPFVTGDPWVRFYAGQPLRSRDGFMLGTLCAID
nr:GAF domain-containing protein [Polyangiaceae bacterium]